MGRIKTKLVKAKTQEIMSLYAERMSQDFTHNKTALKDVAVIHSKKQRNTIAGYLVRLKKKEE
jgi:small subunit ribosomal protein S17e